MLKNRVGFNTFKTDLVFVLKTESIFTKIESILCNKIKIEWIFISCDPLSVCYVVLKQRAHHILRVYSLLLYS